MVKKILLPNGMGVLLAKKFGVSTRTVIRALNYQRDSPIAQTIRKAAFEMGGRLYDGTRTEDTGTSIFMKQDQESEE